MTRSAKWAGLSAVNLLVFGAMLFLGSGCTEEPPAVTASVLETTLRLTSPTAMGGKIVIERAYLKLEYIQAAGMLAGKLNADVRYAVPPEEPPYELTRGDSIRATLSLPARDFDQLDLLLLLFGDDYPLLLTGTVVAPVPQPAPDNTGGSPPSGDDDKGNSGDNNNSPGEEDDDGDEDDHNSGEHDDSGDDDHDDEGQDNDDGDHSDDKKNKDKGSKDDKKKDKHKKKNKHEHDGRTDSENQSVDLDNFFANAKPALVIIGTYDNNGQPINLLFVATDVDRLVVQAEQNDSYHIALGDRNIATVTLDPDQLFEGISAAEIESSRTQPYQGRNVLFIHKDFNTSLYKALVARLEQSCSATISSSVIP